MSDLPAPYARRYTAQAKLFSLLGNAFEIFDGSGQLAFFAKQKAFAWKEKLTIFRDRGQTQPMVTVNARQISDFNVTFDIADAATGDKVGAARRKGLKSLFKDEWSVLDTSDREVGLMVESGGLLSALRRLIDLLRFLPQSYTITLNGQEEATVRQRFNFFRLRYDVEVTGSGIDPRMVVGLVVLLLAIEGKRDG